jgi:outer membrane protein TolC
MFRLPRPAFAAVAVLAATVLSLSGGCTSPRQYVQSGYKVGPNYRRPEAPVAERWIDARDPNRRVREVSGDLSRWWSVFNDPVLDRLMTIAYEQNLTLREAGYRVLQARAQLGIARGTFFPQLQNSVGGYRRVGANTNFFDQWNSGFNLAWELDVWGRLRRAIAAADDQLDASVEDYDFVLVTLLGDVATNYVQIRTDQQRIVLLQKNARLQERVLNVVTEQRNAGAKGVTDVEVAQALSNLKQTQAQIPQLEIDKRQAMNALCILLGMPPVELQKTLDVWAAEDLRKAKELETTAKELEDVRETGDLSKPQVRQRIKTLWKTIGTAYIPAVPREVAVGIPAELLRRRPDVQAAERRAAAQAEQIGIAEAALYPLFSLSGTINYQANKLSQLFTSDAFSGSVGPSFQWNILNYGRIVNNVRFQDATFQQLVAAYQNTVLQAASDVENGLVAFLQSQDRADLLGESAEAGQSAVIGAIWQYSEGTTTFNQYAVIEQALVQQEDSWAQARGQIALGLIQVYRALGGGWQIRLQNEEATAATSAAPPGALQGPEELPRPLPRDAGAPKNRLDAPKRPEARLEDPPEPPTAREPGASVASDHDVR